jgi:serine/threonine-protein kinase
VIASTALAIGLALILLANFIYQRSHPSSELDRAIAVLPFENFSSNADDRFLAAGIQDEILTKLAVLADLKVIARTSSESYQPKPVDLRIVGRQLGVGRVLEGSIQRSGDKVRVNVQLIDTHTNAHLWANSYDRQLDDVLAVRSEIAKTVAEQLEAKISPNEKKAIERAPTADVDSFALYTRAKNLLLMTTFASSGKTDLLDAVDLLNQAVASAPSFFRGYCELARAHQRLYFLGHDHTPARLALADAALQKAFRLRPDAGEAHLVRAENLFRGYLDYDGALAELELAHRTLPNDPRIFELKGYIARRQGRWDEARRYLESAINLDPRNIFTLKQAAINYRLLGRYPEEKAILDRALTIEPNDVETKVARATVEFEWKADTRPLHDTIDSIRDTNPAALPAIAADWLNCALAERDAVAAQDALNALGENKFGLSVVQFNRPFVEGMIARMAKDEAKARSAFTAARVEQEQAVQAQPNYGPPLCVLGLIDAALGRKEEALREGRRAVELLPAEKDALNGPIMVHFLAMIAAWVGEKETATAKLATVIQPPSYVTYGQLKLLPFWDPLRGDPQFEKMVASLAPKN